MCNTVPKQYGLGFELAKKYDLKTKKQNCGKVKLPLKLRYWRLRGHTTSPSQKGKNTISVRVRITQFVFEKICYLL